MTCQQVLECVKQARAPGAEPVSPDVLDHLMTCEKCRFLNTFPDLDLTEWEPPDYLQQRITKAIAADLRPVRTLPRNSTLVIRTFSVFFILPTLVLYGIGLDAPSTITPMRLVFLTSAVAVSEIFLSLALISLMVPGCVHHLHPVLLLLLCIGGYILLTSLTYPSWRLPSETGSACLALGGAVAIPAALALWLLARLGNVFSWHMAGSVIGVMSGLTGASVVTLHCAIDNGFHSLFWHTAILVFGLLAGLLSGAIVERATPARPAQR